MSRSCAKLRRERAVGRYVSRRVALAQLRVVAQARILRHIARTAPVQHPAVVSQTNHQMSSASKSKSKDLLSRGGRRTRRRMRSSSSACRGRRAVPPRRRPPWSRRARAPCAAPSSAHQTEHLSGANSPPEKQNAKRGRGLGCARCRRRRRRRAARPRP